MKRLADIYVASIILILIKAQHWFSSKKIPYLEPRAQKNDKFRVGFILSIVNVPAISEAYHKVNPGTLFFSAIVAVEDAIFNS